MVSTTLFLETCDAAFEKFEGWLKNVYALRYGGKELELEYEVTGESLIFPVHIERSKMLSENVMMSKADEGPDSVFRSTGRSRQAVLLGITFNQKRAYTSVSFTYFGFC